MTVLLFAVRIRAEAHVKHMKNMFMKHIHVSKIACGIFHF